MKTWIKFSLGIFGITVVALGCYLFRIEVLPSPALKIQYRWGAPARLFQDIDEDGRAEIIMKVSAPFGGYSPHTAAVVAAFYDEDLNGLLDVEVIFSPSSHDVLLFKKDSDGDGSFETVLSGVRAQKKNEELERRFRSLLPGNEAE